MSKIVDAINNIEDLDCISGCTEKQIKDAEKALGLVFPLEYKEYVQAFGAISFADTEWTGLNVDGSLNVVDVTLRVKEWNAALGNSFFVLENLGIEDEATVVNEKGEVFWCRRDAMQKVANSLLEYLESYLANK